MISSSMLRGVEYALALVLFTGCLCEAGPLEGSPFGGGGFMSQLHVQQFLQGCRDDPDTEWKLKTAEKNLLVCMEPFMEELKHTGSFSPEDGQNGVLKLTKAVCKMYGDMKPCMHDFLTTMKMCLHTISVKDALEGYQQAISVVCSDDGEKLMFAIKEFVDEDRDCLKKIDSEVRYCMMTHQKGNHSDAVCRNMDCLRRAMNVCGGPKPTVNQIMIDLTHVSRNKLNCPAYSSALGPSSSPVLSSATVLIALFAIRLLRLF